MSPQRRPPFVNRVGADDEERDPSDRATPIPPTIVMDMDYPDPYQRHQPELPMQPFAGHQQAHPQPMQYPYWNPLMAYYQQQQHRAAALMGHPGIHLAKPVEPKPRLAKDEVELLEREFAKNQKPSSSTKRELAEKMGVEVPRINVRSMGTESRDI